MMLTLPLLLTHCKEIQEKSRIQKKYRIWDKFYGKKFFWNIQLLVRGRESRVLIETLWLNENFSQSRIHCTGF